MLIAADHAPQTDLTTRAHTFPCILANTIQDRRVGGRKNSEEGRPLPLTLGLPRWDRNQPPKRCGRFYRPLSLCGLFLGGKTLLVHPRDGCAVVQGDARACLWISLDHIHPHIQAQFDKSLCFFANMVVVFKKKKKFFLLSSSLPLPPFPSLETQLNLYQTPPLHSKSVQHIKVH